MMNLQTQCPKCEEPKLSHTVLTGTVLAVKCRACKWTKELGKAPDQLTNQDYE